MQTRTGKPHSAATRTYHPTAVRFPQPASAALPVQGADGAPAVAAGSTSVPVSVRAVRPRRGAYAGPAAVDVAVQPQSAASKAGVDGVLLSVTPGGTRKGSGSAQLSLDYSGFAQAYGAGYGGRLHLVRLPACALTTPQLAECRTQTPLASRNNAGAKTLSANVPLTAPAAATPAAAGTAAARSLSTATASPAAEVMVLAAVSGTGGGDGGGPSGNYSATTLSPSGSWSGGSSNGSFTYSYPIVTPPAVSDLVPKIELGYDSGSVDGQTSAVQAQSSWVGDGWSTPQSYIERSYIPCSDQPEGKDAPTSTSDECWDGEILTLSLNGSSNSLVYDAAKQTYTPTDDNGEVVKHVTDSGNGSGTYNTDYWTVTTRDGAVYSFGRNELPGWASGKTTTNSVDSQRVYAAHSGDPCYKSTFSTSYCTMAYRWNLDYVKDLHGNAMAYYYKQDTNKYGAGNATTPVSYVRDSHLDHVDYGFTDGGAYGTVPDKVLFTTGDRCVLGASSCSPLSSTTKANWPDVPYDLVCTSTTSCSQHAPSMFSTVRLTGITTQQYSPAASAYKTVDSWALNETMPVAGDGNATLWLDSITRTGSDQLGGGSTTDTKLPAVTFGAVDLQNRVDTTHDGLPPLYRFRVNSITSESGSVTGVQYLLTDPCTAPVKTTPSANTSSCYPVYWTPEFYTAPIQDWFNKWAVQKVTQTDPTGGAPQQTTSYEYSGPAWHYDDNELVKAKYRTYGQWRGYQDVQTFTGDGVNDPRTESETVYYQGMSRDNSTTAVDLTDSQGGRHDDNNLLAGKALEATVYRGDGGAVDNSAISSFWVSPATATRTRTGLPDLTANTVAPVEVWSRQALTADGTTKWRVNETDTSYDDDTASATFGLTTAVYTHTVPADPAYDQCDTTTYAKANTSLNLAGLVSGTEGDAVACGGFTEGSTASVPGSVNTLTAPASVNRPDQVISATRTFYDDPTGAATWPQPAGPVFPQTTAPTKGDASISQKATGASGGALTWQTTAAQVFDSAGRPTDSWAPRPGDASATPAGIRTRTTWSADSAGNPTGSTVTNTLSQSSTTTLDPARGLTVGTTDANGVKTVTHYDTLGRATGLWLASRPTSGPADYTYAYQVSGTGITAVTTNKLNDSGGYRTSTEIYDAMLRVRQTQDPTPQGGRMVSDTFYDSHGWKSATYNGWWDSATAPNTTLVTAADLHDQVPDQDYLSYDGQGRVVIDQSEKDNVEISRTTTVYNGDRTTVIAPTGGVTKTTVADAMGRTSELDEYTDAPTLHTPADTFTGVFTVTGGSTQATRYGFDAHGNQNTVQAGGQTWTNTFDLLGRVTDKVDPDAGHSVSHYDLSGNVLQTTDSRGKSVSYTYDALGRKTAEFTAPSDSQSAGNEIASWVYDNSDNAVPGMTNPVGKTTTSTSYVGGTGGAAYRTQDKGFNVYGASVGETVTIPATADTGALAGTYTFSHTFTSTTGLPFRDTYSSAAGLPQETVGHSYTTALDLPNGLGGTNGYAQSTSYDAYGRVQQETLGSGTSLAYLTNTYDQHTDSLTDQLITRSTAAPSKVDEVSYDYDLAGNITRQTDTRLGAATPDETQCYQYDQIDRLTQAWTATDSCALAPTALNHSMIGDSVPGGAYWTSWLLDPLGNRQTQTDHSTSGGADTTTSYGYDGNGKNQPHTLTSTSGGSGGATSYGYDSAGDMTSRTTPGQGAQTLAWDDAGRLTDITGGTAGDSSYVYGPDGSVLLEKDPKTTTLYLPGEQIVLDNNTGGLTGDRYYPLPGGGTAVRASTTGGTSDYDFEFGDQHGTNGLMLDSTAQLPTWRQFTPYGATRGNSVSWADNRGFLDAPNDAATGLSILGARQYDPDTGRFISLDPLFEATSPQELNGYSYAGDNPVNQSDPAGTSWSIFGLISFVVSIIIAVIVVLAVATAVRYGRGRGTHSSGGGSKGGGRPKYGPFVPKPQVKRTVPTPRAWWHGLWSKTVSFLSDITAGWSGPGLCGNSAGAQEGGCNALNGLLVGLGGLNGMPNTAIDLFDKYKGDLLLAKKGLHKNAPDYWTLKDKIKAANNSKINNLSKFADNPLWRASGKAMVGVGAGLSTWAEYDTARDLHYSKTGSAVRAGAAGVADTATSYAMAAEGAEWGAAIGTMIEPGVGTVVGGVIGGAAGAIASVPVTNIINNAINSKPVSHVIHSIKSWF
ncbi:RHS repeat-associated core domain-containing protein [Peterkaempfera sp. SMS 1(5)a]|uniref:RHS repeat domain-containing protein n=1 Tax=Peterkaempfera podocarpi TaxID=3232308 RepID=UPI0036718AD8